MVRSDRQCRRVLPLFLCDLAPHAAPNPAACGAFHFTAAMMASKPHRPFEILWRLLQQGGQPPDEFKDVLFYADILGGFARIVLAPAKWCMCLCANRLRDHLSLASFRRPQCFSFRDGSNTRSTWRFRETSPGDLVRSALRGGAHPLSHQITNLSVSPKRQFRSETRPVAEWVWI
jgi:hypothetical protein